jgi:hypothetical protein
MFEEGSRILSAQGKSSAMSRRSSASYAVVGHVDIVTGRGIWSFRGSCSSVSSS